MNITSSLLSSNLFSASELTGSAATTSSSSPGTTAANPTSDSSSVNLSDPAKLFAELEKLSKSNPAEFKKITAEIAQQLESAAKNATDPGESNFLSQMASNFTKASQTGKFSDLFPSAPPHGSAEEPGTNTTSATVSYGGGSTHKSGDSSDTLSQIFAGALSQIQADLSSASTTTS